MNFSVLGPLSASRNGTAIDLGGPRQEIIMAMLLLAMPRTVGVDTLVDSIWPDAPPPTARSQVQICISRLRRILRTGPGAIHTSPPGYHLDLDGAQLDLIEFDAAVTGARSDIVAGRLDEAAVALRAALDLWRGEPLDGIDSPVVRDAATRLADRRLGTVELFVDVELRRSHHAEILDLLATEVDLHPLRDRLRSQLMLSLYRSGRQADALAEFQRGRRHAADELGLDPAPELRELEQAILRFDPGLVAPVQKPDPPVVEVRAEQPGARPLAARMLPPPIADFVGRAGHMTAVTEHLLGAEAGGPVPVVIVSGPGGIGKSTLANHVAQHVTDWFPDGQLYATQQRRSRSGWAAAVLKRFLLALGVPGHAVPESLEQRVEAYHDLLAGRRVLVVLDDVSSAAEITPLLPPDGGSAMVVTSRRRITSLPGVYRVELGTFRPESALALLESMIGADRLGAEPEEAAELVRLCGYLPLAVRIAAARLAARPHWSPATMVERLSDGGGQLDELRHDDMTVRTTLLIAYESLDPGARLLLRLLSLVDSADFGDWVAPVLLDTPVRTAQDWLAELVEIHLVDVDADPAGGGLATRYRLHDLVRLFARERAAQEGGTVEREQAVRRYLGAFTKLLDEAHRRQHGGEYQVARGGAARTGVDARTIDRLLRDPMRWLAVEHQSLVAAVAQAYASGVDDQCWEIALGAVTLFEARAHFDEWRETHAVALMAACRSGDRLGEAAVRYSQGALALVEQRLENAIDLTTRALEAFQQLPDADAARGVAMAHRNLAAVARLRGEAGPARVHYAAALGIFRGTGDRIGLAHALNGLAQIDIEDGLIDEAADRLEEAARLCAVIPNRRVGAQVAYRLGEMHRHAGRLAEAEAAFADVLAFAEAANDPIGEVYGLIGTGSVLVERGEPAVAVLERAAGRAGDVGQLRVQVEALILLSRAKMALPDQAARIESREHAEAAVAVARKLGSHGPIDLAEAQLDDVRAACGGCDGAVAR